MAQAARAVRHLADGYPGLALVAAGMKKARAERLAYAYRVDRLWPARVLRLSLYVTIRLGLRLPVWANVAAWNARRLPMLHKALSDGYRRSLRPHATRPQQWVEHAGPAQRRIQRRLELLRRAASMG